MIAYIFILFSIFAGLSVVRHKNETKIPFLVQALILAFLILICTFRPSEMPDYENYYSIFYTKNVENSRFELGFQWLIGIVHKLSYTHLTLLFIMALISVSLKFYAIMKFSNFVWLSLCLYISNIFILHDMIQIRAAVASGLLLFAIYFRYKKNWISFILATTIAVLFHTSALCFLVIPFFKSDKLNKLKYAIVIPLTYALSVNGITFGRFLSHIPIEAVESSVTAYVSSAEKGLDKALNIFNVLILLRIVITFLLLKYSNKLKSYNVQFVLWLKLYIFSIAFFVLCRDVVVLAQRICEMFAVIEFLLFPMLVYAFKTSDRLQGKLLTVAIAACLLLMNTFYIKLLL